MNIKLHNVNELPVVVIDNYYNHKEVKNIWQEIKQFSSNPKLWQDPNNTGAAWIDEDGKKTFIKQNKGLSLDKFFNENRSKSKILFENRKLFNSITIDQLSNLHYFFNFLNIVNQDFTLLSYYDNEDCYHQHEDGFVITAISWFFEKPRRFSGGNLIFNKTLSVECEFNRTVIFPSILSHEVSRVELNQNDMGKFLGRFTISQFLTILPS